MPEEILVLFLEQILAFLLLPILLERYFPESVRSIPLQLPAADTRFLPPG